MTQQIYNCENGFGVSVIPEEDCDGWDAAAIKFEKDGSWDMFPAGGARRYLDEEGLKEFIERIKAL